MIQKYKAIYDVLKRSPGICGKEIFKLMPVDLVHEHGFTVDKINKIMSAQDGKLFVSVGIKVDEIFGNKKRIWENKMEREDTILKVIKAIPGIFLDDITKQCIISDKFYPNNNQVTSTLLSKMLGDGMVIRDSNGGYSVVGKYEIKQDISIDDVIEFLKNINTKSKIENEDMKRAALLSASSLNPIFLDILKDIGL